MSKIAIAEIISAVFVLMLLISRLAGRERTVSVRRLMLLYALVTVSLLADAFSYILEDPAIHHGVNHWGIHLVNMLAFVMSDITLIGFIYYCAACIRKKTDLDRWVFIAPAAALALSVPAVIVWYLLGRLVVFEGGVYRTVGTVPVPVLACYMAVLFYIPVVAFIKRKDLGMRTVLLMSSYGVPVVITVVILLLTDYDFSTLAAAFSVTLITVIMQSDVTREQITQAAAQHALAENNARVIALEDRLVSVYDVDLETGRYEVYIKEQDKDEDIRTHLTVGENFFEDALKNAESMVYEEDRLGVQKMMDPDYIRQMLEAEDHFDRHYRVALHGEPEWVRMRVLYKDESRQRLIVGIFDAQEEMTAKQKNEQLREELVRRMSGEDGVFLIDCANNTRRTIRDRTYGAANYSDVEQYSESFARYIDNFVAEPDRAMLREVTAPAYMLERVKKEPEYLIRYRDTTTGVRRYFEMRVAAFSDTEVLQSFREKDREIVENMVFSKLKEEYFSLFTVDLDVGLAQVIRDERRLIADPGTVTPYTPMMENVADTFDGETKVYLTNISDRGYLKYRFAKEDKSTYAYKSHLREGAWGCVTELVLARHADGTPSMLAIGFSLLDTEAGENAELQIRLKEDMQMIGGIADEYHTLYYVNIDEKIFKVYRIDGQKFPEHTQYVREDGDPITMLREFGQSPLIHPDDRKLFDELSVEAVREKLAHSKRFSVRFRRSFGGEYRWLEMDMIKYEETDEPANVIAVGFAFRDAEIRREQAFADVFLHAYVSAYYVCLTDCSQIVFSRSEFIEKR